MVGVRDCELGLWIVPSDFFSNGCVTTNAGSLYHCYLAVKLVVAYRLLIWGMWEIFRAFGQRERPTFVM